MKTAPRRSSVFKISNGAAADQAADQARLARQSIRSDLGELRRALRSPWLSMVLVGAAAGFFGTFLGQLARDLARMARAALFG